MVTLYFGSLLHLLLFNYIIWHEVPSVRVLIVNQICRSEYGANNETEAEQNARSVASSSLTKAWCTHRNLTVCIHISWLYLIWILSVGCCIWSRPKLGRLSSVAGYAGIQFDPNMLWISLGNILPMDEGQPLPFDRKKILLFCTQSWHHQSLLIVFKILARLDLVSM